MCEALKAFQAVPDVQAKHLIVITDGNDEIYGVPPWLKSFRASTGKKDFEAEQVGLLLRDQYPDVDVSVLGIALSSFRGTEPINALARRAIQFYTVSRQQRTCQQNRNRAGARQLHRSGRQETIAGSHTGHTTSLRARSVGPRRSV